MVSRRELLGSIGIGGVGIAGYVFLSGCGSNLDEIDQGYVGSRTTLEGRFTSRSSDNSRVSLTDGEESFASIAIQQQYQRHVDDAELGDCMSVSAYITNEDDGRIRGESGEIR